MKVQLREDKGALRVLDLPEELTMQDAVQLSRDLIDAALEGRSLHVPSGADSAIDHTYVDDFVDGTLAASAHQSQATGGRVACQR